MEIIRRKDAKAQGLKRYYTGKPCREGHDCERIVTTGHCMRCAAAIQAKYRKDDPERYRERTRQYLQSEKGKAWVARNRERLDAYYAEWAKANKKQLQAYWRQYREDNLDHKKRIDKAWRDANRELRASFSSARRAQQRQAMAWAATEREAITAIYALRDYMQAVTGVEHHVDHIVPLVNPRVCGLHVAANLRVIPAADNLTKGNRVWPDMAEEI